MTLDTVLAWVALKVKSTSWVAPVKQGQSLWVVSGVSKVVTSGTCIFALTTTAIPLLHMVSEPLNISDKLTESARLQTNLLSPCFQVAWGNQQRMRDGLRLPYSACDKVIGNTR